MRTLFSLAFAMLFLAALSSYTFAQQQRCNGPCPDDQKMMGREITPENFTEVKARMLTMIEKRKTWLDTEKSCVEAAASAEELKKCRPERPMGMGGGNGPGSQRGPRAGMGGQQQ